MCIQKAMIINYLISGIKMKKTENISIYQSFKLNELKRQKFTITAPWSDFDMNLNKIKPGIDNHQKGFGGDIIRDIDTEAVKNSLTNILGTLQGSRRMLPEFALGLYHILFEPIDPGTTNIIRNYIISAINTWDNRVELESVNVNPKHDDNLYEIVIRFYIKNKNISKEIHEIDYILKRLG